VPHIHGFAASFVVHKEDRMDHGKPKALAELRNFFSDELKRLFEKNKLSSEQDSFHYLVNLMVHHMESERFFAKDEEGRMKSHVVAGLYAEYRKGASATKQIVLRKMGDVCLMVTGFFPDSLNRKLVDIDYYSGMGGTAYWQLSHLQMTNLTR